jgi:lipopolysaccharide export system protein LptA
LQAKGYKISEYYPAPYELQLKSMLEGGKVVPQGDGKVLELSEGVLLRTFSITNTPQLIVETPQCRYDSVSQSALSSERLRVRTADGKFVIEGAGFLWRQTNSNLTISNSVHTTVHPELLEASHATGTTNVPAPSELKISSDRFDYVGDQGLGFYRGHVQVIGTNLDLRGGALLIKIPVDQRQLESITVTQSVVLDYTTLEGRIQATGEQAVYTASNGLARITGHPTWRADQREGRGDELLIDRTNKIFQANGQAWLKAPGGALGETGFLTSSNQVSQLEVSNRWVEISCGDYEFRTNWARFHKNVLVSELVGGGERSRMTCDLMLATFTVSNQLERIEAEKDVLIQQSTNQFAAGRALYMPGTNGVLELWEHPSWRAGLREGKGERIRGRANAMDVIGKAFLRLPAAELAESAAAGTGGTSNAPAGSTHPQYAEIFCQEYTITTNLARFRGGVYASHTNMNWSCELLSVPLPGPDAKIETVVAEQNVVFDLRSDQGEKVHGKGDKAVYTYGINGYQTNVLHLMGSPAMLERTNVTVWNERIILDRLNNTLQAPGGQYRVRGVGPATDTNLFKTGPNKILK